MCEHKESVASDISNCIHPIFGNVVDQNVIWVTGKQMTSRLYLKWKYLLVEREYKKVYNQQ